jgi:hypothetical protein
MLKQNFKLLPQQNLIESLNDKDSTSLSQYTSSPYIPQ